MATIGKFGADVPGALGSFIAVVAVVLFVVDGSPDVAPTAPWLAFIGPTFLIMVRRPHLPGCPHHLPVVLRTLTATPASASTTTRRSSRHDATTSSSCATPCVWVLDRAVRRDRHRPHLRHLRRQGQGRGARQGVHLPADGHLVRRRIDHLEVRLRLPARPGDSQPTADRPAQPDHGLARRDTPQQWLLNSPWNTLLLIVVMIWIQAGFAMTILSAAIKAIPDDIIEAARLDGVVGMELFRFDHGAEHPAGSGRRPHHDRHRNAQGVRHRAHHDRRQLRAPASWPTSSITQSFRASNQGLGAALAVLLFILVIPIVVYNVRQLRAIGGSMTPSTPRWLTSAGRRPGRCPRSPSGSRRRLTSPWASLAAIVSRSCGRSRPSACSSRSFRPQADITEPRLVDRLPAPVVHARATTTTVLTTESGGGDVRDLLHQLDRHRHPGGVHPDLDRDARGLRLRVDRLQGPRLPLHR